MHIKRRLVEPSSFAGYSAIAIAIPELIATGGNSPTAWGAIISALFAIFRGEKSGQAAAVN